jgi:lipopolysaccharide assembly protein A
VFMTAPSHGGNTGQERPRETPAPMQPPAKRVVTRARIRASLVRFGLFAVVSLLLLVFILENGQHVEVSYFGAHWHQPLGVTLLLAAVLGFLLAVIAGFRRLVRGRTAARRNRKT